MKIIYLIGSLGLSLAMTTPSNAADPKTMLVALQSVDDTTNTVQSGGLIQTTKVTHPSDEPSGTLITTTITNAPIPNPPEPRAKTASKGSQAPEPARPGHSKSVMRRSKHIAPPAIAPTPEPMKP